MQLVGELLVSHLLRLPVVVPAPPAPLGPAAARLRRIRGITAMPKRERSGLTALHAPEKGGVFWFFFGCGVKRMNQLKGSPLAERDGKGALFLAKVPCFWQGFFWTHLSHLPYRDFKTWVETRNP